MSNRTVLYIIAVSICAVLANGALFLLAPHVQTVEIRAVIWMAAIGLFVHVLTFRLPRGGSGSIAFIPFLAASIISPTWFAAVAASAVIFFAQLSKRSSPVKALFNFMQAWLAGGIATIVFRLVSSNSLISAPTIGLLDGARANAIAVLVLIGTFFAVNTALVAGVI
ncbi:MAG TPA: hypothetical protein VK617_09775, partial [Gemmatimonadaceae bacterium]|nr:hypothetical protein [Gemmatimonadaceae bacterium]